MTHIVGATHEFHDDTYSRGWADRFIPTPDRLQLFEAIHQQVAASIAPNGNVVELGVGPGYLAEYLLQRLPEIRYHAVDFSEPMLGLARTRLARYWERVEYIQADLVHDDWWLKCPTGADAAVSTWSLHDLGSPEHTAIVYAACKKLLRPDGIFLNGDFIKPDGTRHEYEPGRFEIARHLEMLKRAGFRTAECIMVLEHELENPTSAQNYACLRAAA